MYRKPMGEIQLDLKSKLVRLLWSKKWLSTYRFLKTSKGKKQAKRLVLGVTSPLSIALDNEAPLQIIETLLELAPQTALLADRNGMIPLHIACLNGAPSDVIQLLTNHDQGSAVLILSSEKKTALHYLTKFICDPLEINRCKQRSSIRPSSNGSNHVSDSVMCTCGIFSSEDIVDHFKAVQNLILVAPDSIWLRDQYGETVFDILKNHRSCDTNSECAAVAQILAQRSSSDLNCHRKLSKINNDNLPEVLHSYILQVLNRR